MGHVARVGEEIKYNGVDSGTDRKRTLNERSIEGKLMWFRRQPTDLLLSVQQYGLVESSVHFVKKDAGSLYLIQ